VPIVIPVNDAPRKDLHDGLYLPKDKEKVRGSSPFAPTIMKPPGIESQEVLLSRVRSMNTTILLI
jgi:hypothetical protein